MAFHSQLPLLKYKVFLLFPFLLISDSVIALTTRGQQEGRTTEAEGENNRNF